MACAKAKSLERKGGVSGIDVEDDARALVNDIQRYPHAFVLASIADRLSSEFATAWAVVLASWR